MRDFDEQEQLHANYWTVKFLFFNTQKALVYFPGKGAKDVLCTPRHWKRVHTLSEGQRVTFGIQPDKRGSKAVNLRSASALESGWRCTGRSSSWK